jgi:hypothetical protein
MGESIQLNIFTGIAVCTDLHLRLKAASAAHPVRESQTCHFSGGRRPSSRSRIRKKGLLQTSESWIEK